MLVSYSLTVNRYVGGGPLDGSLVITRNDNDRRVATKESPLRPLEDLDTLDVVQAGTAALRGMEYIPHPRRWRPKVRRPRWQCRADPTKEWPNFTVETHLEARHREGQPQKRCRDFSAASPVTDTAIGTLHLLFACHVRP